MSHLTDAEIREQTQRKRAQLEQLRSEMRSLHGEARLQADQHINKLNDEIEELERHPKSELESMEPEGIGLFSAIKNAWRDLTGHPDYRSDGTPDREPDRRHL